MTGRLGAGLSARPVAALGRVGSRRSTKRVRALGVATLLVGWVQRQHQRRERREADGHRLSLRGPPARPAEDSHAVDGAEDREMHSGSAGRRQQVHLGSGDVVSAPPDNAASLLHPALMGRRGCGEPFAS
jgi:hypothetical protein